MGTGDTQLTHANHAGEEWGVIWQKLWIIHNNYWSLASCWVYNIYSASTSTFTRRLLCFAYTNGAARNVSVCVIIKIHIVRTVVDMVGLYAISCVITPDYQIKFHNRFVCIFVVHFLFHFIFSSLFVYFQFSALSFVWVCSFWRRRRRLSDGNFGPNLKFCCEALDVLHEEWTIKIVYCNWPHVCMWDCGVYGAPN